MASVVNLIRPSCALEALRNALYKCSTYLLQMELVYWFPHLYKYLIQDHKMETK